MFSLDDKFLEDIGLTDLPEDQKKAFLQHIYEELELRVGTQLSEGLSDQQLEEFEKIIDKDQTVIGAWISQYAPDYQNDDIFKRMQQALNLQADDVNLKSEYVATKWLEVNRPDYRDVVRVVMDELKNEIISNRDAILGPDSQQPVAA